MRFQHSRNPRTSAEQIPPAPRGSPIYRNIFPSPAPSILADSTTASGMPVKKRYMINTGNVENAPGRITAQSVSIRLSRSSTR